MVEYGHGVSEGAGQVSRSGRGGLGSGGGDWGARIGDIAGDAVNGLAGLSPAQLLLLIAVLVVGLFVLKRAF